MQHCSTVLHVSVYTTICRQMYTQIKKKQVKCVNNIVECVRSTVFYSYSNFGILGIVFCVFFCS